MPTDVTMLPAFLPALPEIVLAVGALVLLMIGAYGGERATPAVTGLSIALIVVAGGVLVLYPTSGATFNGSFVLDGYARLMKVLALIGSGVAIVMSIGYARAHQFERFEYPVLIVIATLGMMMMISATDLIALYIGLELQSLALYVVAAINRDSLRSTEAGLKYFVLGALSSGMLLYGASLIYGFTGQTSFAGIAAALQGQSASLGLIFGLVFLIAGLAFKVSAVPFHMWTPDVYEGAPTPVTAFFAAAPKVAAMALFVRAIVVPFGAVTPDWQQIIAFISIASMALGSFAAIGQQNIKRLMAYSSIGHMGFALVGLAAGNQAGVKGVIIYLLIYLAMNLGAFACILAMRRGNVMVESISDLAGLSRTNPMMAFMLAMILFSLAGIPPLAGFFAKFYVFLAAIQVGLYPLAVIGVLASVVGAYYYLRIVKIMYFDEPAARFEPMPVELRVVLGVSGAFILLFIFIAGQIGGAAELAAKTLF
jgi:NADH-quinone oxidoreductase subunit N